MLPSICNENIEKMKIYMYNLGLSLQLCNALVTIHFLFNILLLWRDLNVLMT